MTTFFESGYYNTYRNRLACQLLLKECRLKTLRDLCLECVGKNLHCITRASQYLAPLHKELVIERLAFHDQLIPAYLPHVTYNLFSPSLKRINLYRCPQIDETLLKLLAKSKCKLQSLTINDCEQVTDGALLAITKDQTELQVLHLRKLKITKKGVLNICSPCLEEVNLRSCNNLDNTALQTIVSANRSIKYLSIVCCQTLTEDAFSIIANHLKGNLESLDAAEVHSVNDNSLTPLAELCPNLKSINVLGCNKLTETSILKLFEKCQQLQSLDISYCSKLTQTTPSAREVMLHLPITLHELALNGLILNDGELLAEGLGCLKKLKRLKLCGVPALDDESMEQVMQKIGSQLEFFDICGSVMSQITDYGLKFITRYCTQLETLGISLLKEVTGVTLLPLLEDHKRAPKLKRLLLCCRKLDVSVVHAITENCYSLLHLDISGLGIITDDILVKLASNCTDLSDINIKACRNVTDAGVISLAISCPLCVAVLSGLHNITDKSILAIANNCPYLEELYISGCDKVSPAAVKYLKDVCIPRVYVSHRVPNAQNTARNLDTGNYDVYTS